MEEFIAHAAMILNVPNIDDETPGLYTEVSVRNLKQMLIEAYEEGRIAGLERAVEIYDQK